MATTDPTQPIVTTTGGGDAPASRKGLGDPSRRDILSSVIILIMIVLFALIFAWRLEPSISPNGRQPRVPKATDCKSTLPATAASGQLVKVGDAPGAAPLNIFVGRTGNDIRRQSVPLAVQKGSLCPNEILAATNGDFVRSDGATLPASQVAVWGQVDATGTHVIMWVHVAPRYGQVSGFGDYSGTVALADPHAFGGNVAVNIYVLYPDVNFVVVFSMFAAFAGFIWAGIVHALRHDQESADEYFWRNLVLRMAVVLVASIPVVNAQVLANPAWRGDLSQYIALATLSGGAAIALTPTLRALALPAKLPNKVRRRTGGKASPTGKASVGENAEPMDGTT